MRGSEASPGTTSAKPRFVVLDALRGVAAVVVVILHYNMVVWPDHWRERYLGHSGGYLAVDFFIILSGFVLAHAYFDRKSFDLWDFFKRRMFRFWPLHMVTLCVVTLLMWRSHEWMTWQGFAINVTLLHNIGIGNYGLKFNVPSWSLSVELAVNMVVGALILAAPERRLNTLIMSALVVFGGAVVLLGHHNLNANEGNVLGVLNLGVMRGLMDFPIGVLTYRVFTTRKDQLTRLTSARPLLIGALLLLFLSSFYIPAMHARDFLWLPVYALIVLLMAQPSPVWTQRLAWLRPLGDISFSLYLVHFGVEKAVAMIHPAWMTYMSGLVMTLSVSLVIAWVAHTYFETPVYNRLVERWCRNASNRRLPDMIVAALRRNSRRLALFKPARAFDKED